MKFFHTILSFFSRSANIIAFILLLLSGASSSINPDYFWSLGLLGLAYPYIALLNIFFVISWILRKRFFFIFSLLGLMITFNQLKAQIVFPIFQNSEKNSSDIRVMSYNVRNFDLYNWSNNTASRKSMMDSIVNLQPDVLFLQEFYTDKKNFKNTEYLDSLGYKYHAIALEYVKNDKFFWGVAIFSKYPILESGEVVRQTTPSPYGKFYNRGVFADIEVKEQKIRLISVHLQSIYLGTEDYNTIQEIKEDNPSKIKKIIPIVKKLGKAFRQRGIQTAELKSFIESSPYPVILGGDFNDTPGSYAYHEISNILDDAFIQKGKYIGATYNGIIPFLRIDYIFMDAQFSCTQFKKVKNVNSDHFPIIADIHIPEKIK